MAKIQVNYEAYQRIVEKPIYMKNHDGSLTDITPRIKNCLDVYDTVFLRKTNTGSVGKLNIPVPVQNNDVSSGEISEKLMDDQLPIFLRKTE